MCSRHLVRSTVSRSIFSRLVYSPSVGKCRPSIHTHWLCLRGKNVGHVEYPFQRTPQREPKMSDIAPINQERLDKNSENTAINSPYQSKPGITKRLTKDFNDKSEGNTEEFKTTRADSRTGEISPKLTETSKRVDYVKRFDIWKKKLAIDVLEGHEAEATRCIGKVLKKQSFNGEHVEETFLETDYINMHGGRYVGGHAIMKKSDGKNISRGTIGCFLQLRNPGDQDKKIYAVTCHHVANPDNMDKTMGFYNHSNVRFSNQVEFHLLDNKIPADIALIPVESPCQVYQLEQCGEWTPFKANGSCVVEGLHVEKLGAVTGSTKGKILFYKHNFHHDMIIVQSLDVNQPFSAKGDSGSLVVALVDDQALWILSGVLEMEGGKEVSVAFALGKAINQLKRTNEIEGDFHILLTKRNL